MAANWCIASSTVCISLCLFQSWILTLNCSACSVWKCLLLPLSFTSLYHPTFVKICSLGSSSCIPDFSWNSSIVPLHRSFYYPLLFCRTSLAAILSASSSSFTGTVKSLVEIGSKGSSRDVLWRVIHTYNRHLLGSGALGERVDLLLMKNLHRSCPQRRRDPLRRGLYPHNTASQAERSPEVERGAGSDGYGRLLRRPD